MLRVQFSPTMPWGISLGDQGSRLKIYQSSFDSKIPHQKNAGLTQWESASLTRMKLQIRVLHSAPVSNKITIEKGVHL